MSNEIAAAFGIDAPTEYPVREETAIAAIDEVKDKLQERIKTNVDKDYDFVRDNLRTMILDTMQMVPNLVDLVNQAESPRMYESASAFMKMIADLNKDLLATSKELEKGAVKGAPTVQPTNPEGGATNIYIGTGSDIFAQLSKPKVTMSTIEELPVINS